MRKVEERFGLSAALTLPVGPADEIDHARLAAHARWCLDHGCDSVTAFGTTGEGASVGLAERERVFAAFAAARIAGGDVVGGIAASAVTEAAGQALMALDFGCRALLLPPPFYFKGVGDAGLFAWFARLFEALGGAARGVILYNIPSVTQVPLSLELVGRLRTAFPEVIAGVKDSSGDWPYTERLLAGHGDLAVMIGDERHLAEGVRRGAQGAISGLANVCPETLVPMVREGRGDRRVERLVDELLKHPVIPAVKALVAHRTGDDAWLAVRPPLISLSAADARRLGSFYDTIFAAEAA
ncbi:dihydrodipicolinate synthase family protein [Chelatococcus sp. SYSU_G07232]|uniref:Dihydrodipicolinate synthase family protein n=1 Tax=Chelatococcus albus TaxID=3047466 RepID=A0ABT7AFU1_9HYPH|nr:dihydrodipicolinate synthase family protein [Chelatococcus sp. SYSU_G07232]MDJ1157496.1 dihydrodipicolinate synthase family protein [Chelatococcus sp. SYSU_G07232]